MFANPLGGDGDYEYYQWVSDPGGQIYGFENPIVEVNEPTTFHLSFGDGYNNYNTSIFVDLLPNPLVDLGPAQQNHCIYETVILDAGNPGSTYLWSSGDSTQQITVTTTGLAYDAQDYSVEVINEYGCKATADVTVIFDFDACVGINETDLSNHFNIYPNPSYGLFNLEVFGLEGETEISVINLSGVEIYHETLKFHKEGNLHQLELSNFSKGMYYIRFINADFMHAEKILIR